MATVPDNDMERAGREIAFLRMIRRLCPRDLEIMDRYGRRVVDGMPTTEAARRAFIERGWPEAEACEMAVGLISAPARRWQDALD